jgi:hypothetical protein
MEVPATAKFPLLKSLTAVLNAPLRRTRVPTLIGRIHHEVPQAGILVLATLHWSHFQSGEVID